MLANYLYYKSDLPENQYSFGDRKTLLNTCTLAFCVNAKTIANNIANLIIGLGDITIYASRLLHRSALRYIAYCMTLDNHNL